MWRMEEGPGPVLRIRLERTKGRWKVAKRIRIPRKTLPASEHLPEAGANGRVSGTWFEAVDADGAVVYRLSMREPRRGIEVFHEDGGISRLDSRSDDYSTDLLIPDLPQIESVRVFSEEPGAQDERGKGGALEPVAAFPAREDEPPPKKRKARR